MSNFFSIVFFLELENKRRSDITTAFLPVSEDLTVKLFLFMQAQANCRVGVAALNTLAGYIDWVPMSHITAENCKLLEVLCLLLNEQELQLGAAECLLIAVSRKVSYRFRLTWILSLRGMPVCVPFHVW